MSPKTSQHQGWENFMTALLFFLQSKQPSRNFPSLTAESSSSITRTFGFCLLFSPGIIIVPCLHEQGFPEAARKGVRVRTARAHMTDHSWHPSIFHSCSESATASAPRLWCGWKRPLKACVPADGAILAWSGNLKRCSHCGHALWDFLYQVHLPQCVPLNPSFF